MSNRKGMTIHLTVALIKKSQYFPKPFRSFDWNINVKVDLSNYATKTVLKYLTHVHASSFTLKANSASQKTEIDKLDIDKLAAGSVYLSKLSDVVKKVVYDKLIAKVNIIDNSDFAFKTKYETDKAKLENEIPDVTDFVTNDFVTNTKLTELENTMADVISLATKTALNAVENKMPDVGSLVKKKIMT